MFVCTFKLNLPDSSCVQYILIFILTIWLQSCAVCWSYCVKIVNSTNIMVSPRVLILIYLFQEYKITAATCVPVKLSPPFFLIKTDALLTLQI